MTEIDERIFNTMIELISKDHLKSIIDEAESDELEFKQIYNIPIKEERKNKIIGPLVSFLNSTKGSGLLILGIREKNDIATEIIGVKKNLLNQLRTENALETFIFDSIGSIPLESDKYFLKTKIINLDNETNVYLIKIKGNEKNCVYYSKINGRAYVREGRKSIGLNLNEAIELAIKKNYPKMISKIEINDFNEDNELISRQIWFKYINEGYKPAEKIMPVLFICSDEKIDFVGSSTYFRSENVIDLERYCLEQVNEYQYNYIYYDDLEPISLFYPFKLYTTGSSMIRYKEAVKFKAFTLIFEKSGFTKQEFSIRLTKSEDPTIEEDYNKRIFKPYLTL